MSLVNMSVEHFLGELAQGTPTPGGGSAAALCGALSSALCGMTAKVTHGKEKYRHVWEEMGKIMHRSDRLRECFLELMDADALAYGEVVAALRMPRRTDEEAARRSDALYRANRRATEVPLKTAALMTEIAGWIDVLIDKANPNCISDLGTAVQLMRAGAQSAAYNVRFNLDGTHDPEFEEACRMQLAQTVTQIDAAVALLEKKITLALG